MTVNLGIDPTKPVRAVRGMPRYLRDLARYRKLHSGRIDLVPCLHDWYQEGGTAKGEYFWQDLLVARMVRAADPVRHVDVGSRIDGFVAHVASFREVEVFDIRPITSRIPGVIFRQMDLMQPVRLAEADDAGYCDSLSCLHALEHFGLGRYGDPIDPLGYRRGIANMAALLQPNGTLYLSVPIGQERVEFNANRVFDPRAISADCRASGLTLRALTVVRPDDTVTELEPADHELDALANEFYALGIFVFTRNRQEALG